MIKTVVNAFRALEYVVEQDLRRSEATLPGIAAHLGLQKSTARNLLRTLENCGYLRRTARGIYTTGKRCETLAQGSRGYVGLREMALPVMNRLAAATGESFGLAVLLNGRRFLICRVIGGAEIAVKVEVVDEGKAYGAVTTRTLLAFASPEEQKRFIANHGLPSESEWPEASGGEEALCRELAEIRQRGTSEFARDSVAAIAVPLLDTDGNLVAVLGMYAPAFRSGDQRLSELRRLLLEGAAQILV
ncbi:MAG: helix-turn-helix domain-containing protein [Planctomycetota bacterium]